MGKTRWYVLTVPQPVDSPLAMRAARPLCAVQATHPLFAVAEVPHSKCPLVGPSNGQLDTTLAPIHVHAAA
jgi:hypothetical protein